MLLIVNAGCQGNRGFDLS